MQSSRRLTERPELAFCVPIDSPIRSALPNSSPKPHHPCLEFQSDILVVHVIMEGIRPMKLEGAKRLGFSDEMWRTVDLC